MITYIHKTRAFLVKKYYARRKGFKHHGKLVPFVSPQQGNDMVREAILEGKPLMVARHGSTELGYVSNTSPKMLNQLCQWSGFFPNSESAGIRFRDEYLDWSSQIDLFAVWNYRRGRFRHEEKIFNLTGARAQLIDLLSLSPFLFESAWSSVLANKKVLVVHPFKKSILEQYQKKQFLFENKNILPDFKSFEVLPAVQSIGGGAEGFATWFDALQWMKDEMSKIDFDVALLGCGAYGLPLAAHAKALGKQGIHIGGTLQLLFGIKGRRWEDASYAYDKKFYNEHWIRPSEEETPKAAQSVEGACYW